VRIGVLGPLTVGRDGAVTGLGPARQRAVLGLLALHGPAGVPRDVIIDVLWPERAPRSASAQVQTYISRLRRLLGPGGPVTLAGGCYRLGREIGLDLADFGQLSRHAGTAKAQGQPRLAFALYERSLGLWRGDLLADVELLQGYPAAAEVIRRRGETVLGFARAAASLGWQSQVLPDLRLLCAREHFNEVAHAHLMTALAAAGQQAAAIGVFWHLKGRLDTELGIAPGPALAAAYLKVLRQQAG
jgi:DNA-binding SARP family transcriptional activator